MLEVKDIHSYYGKSHILQGVSMTLNEGEVVCLLGRNGVGKSTTLKSTMGAGWGALLPPEWSVIHITGNVITKAEALELCKAPRQANEDYRVEELSVRVFGDADVATGRTTVTTGGAHLSTLSLRFTDILVRRHGRWQVVASHATRLGS